MATNSDVYPDELYRFPRKKSGSFTHQDFVPLDKKSRSLSNRSERISRTMSRSQSTADLESVMHNAVLRDDAATLARVLLDKELEIDNFTSVGATALHQAAILGSITCAKMLVEAGANIYVKTVELKVSALQLACSNGHFEVAEYLIAVGAQDEDIKDGSQQTKRCKEGKK